MKILGLETSALTASVALIENQKLIAEYSLNYKQTHSQTLMPMLDEICARVDLDLSSIDYIACCSGPGSFTGLRIGAATAKGLAHGLNKPIIPVPTLDALAYNIFNTDKIICPIMDARRQQVYSAFYRWENGKIVKLTEYLAEPFTVIADIARSFDQEILFCGDGVPVFLESLALEKNFLLTPASCNSQRASSVASLGFELAKEGKFINGRDFVPFYLRKSQAERELLEKKTKEESNV